jgi:hypothetical protein
MSIHRCPQCSIPYVDDEITQGVCPACNAPLAPPPAPPRNVATPAPVAAPIPRRAGSFLLGLLVGCLIGLGALWGALRLGAPLPGGAIEWTAAFQSLQAQKTEADSQAREAEAGRQAAESQHAEAVKALAAANRQTAALQKQNDDAEPRLKDAVARLTEEQARRASLEKALAEKKAGPTPTLSFDRDWQLLGPFASTGDKGHDAVFPPEREPIQLDKTYDGYGGRVKWRSHHSGEDKIDLGNFFHYNGAAVAYAVSWVYSDRDQTVTLSIGSDDGVCVWVNRAKVDDVKAARPASPGQDVVKAHLREGWNEILAKVDNIATDWSLYLEFRTANGSEPLKMFSTNSPPPAMRK